MSKTSFLIHKKFFDPIKDLKDEELGQLFRLIFEYQNSLENPDNPKNPVGSWVISLKKLSPHLQMAFTFFKNQFELDEAKYAAIVIRNQTNGVKGGRPKKPSGLSGNPKNPVGAKKPDNGHDNDKDLLKEDISNDISKKETKKSFTKPTQEEIKNYCLERKNSIDAETFFSFYQSNGWKVGKNPMRDWKAAVRHWESRNKIFSKPENKPTLQHSGFNKNNYNTAPEGFVTE